MRNIIRLTAPAVAAVIALAGCASTPAENPQLSRIEADLRSAYADKYTAEYGHADLAKAEASVAASRLALRKGHDDALQHELTMARGYISLGEIHGRQERAKSETIALKDRQEKIRLAARDRDVQQANRRASDSRSDAAAANIAAQDANARADTSRADSEAANAATQAANDRAESARTDALASKAAADNAEAATKTAENKIESMRTQLRMYDMRITELGATLVLHDVLFDVDSSVLRPGAVNRLDPLIAFLHGSPTTTVRIDGHTDSSGAPGHNQELSLNRADAVKRALRANLSVANAIDTFGHGQDAPIANNATVSGREQNRRVEITLQ